MRHLVPLSVLLLVVSCSIPVTQSHSPQPVTVGVSFSFALSGVKGPANASNPKSRLLLGNVGTISLSVTDNANNDVVFHDQQTIAAAATTATFALSLGAGSSYTVTASAFDSSSVEIFAGQKTVDVTTGTVPGSIALYLLPANFATVSPDQLSSGSVNAGSSVSYYVSYTGINGSVDFNTFGDGGNLQKYYQFDDGTPATADAGLSTMAIAKTALTGSKTGVYVTLYNPSGSSVSYSAFVPHIAASAKWVGGSASVSNLNTTFVGVVHDSAGNSYVASNINTFGGTGGTVEFGAGVGFPTATGSYQTAALVKYDAAGVAQWAMPVISNGSASNSVYHAIAIDSAGNVVLVGEVQNTYNYDFDGVTMNGLTSGGDTAFAVKYDPSGTTQWLVHPTAMSPAPDNSYFADVAIDGSDNAYVVGAIWSANLYVTLTGGVSLQTNSSSGNCPIIAKIDSSGVVDYFASSTATVGGNTAFSHVAVDAVGNAYVLGNVGYTENSLSSFGNTFGSVNFSTIRLVLGQTADFMVKFDSTGAAAWGWGETAPNQSSLNGLAIGSDGSLYVAGNLAATGSSYSMGTNLLSIVPPNYAGMNDSVIVRVSSADGSVVGWTYAAESSSAANGINAISSDSQGNLIVVGWMYGYNSNPGQYNSFNFGSSEFSATPPENGLTNVAYIASFNTLLVANWVHTITAATYTNEFNAVSAGANSIYAVGALDGPGSMTLWPNATYTGAFGGTNAMLYRFDQ